MLGRAPLSFVSLSYENQIYPKRRSAAPDSYEQIHRERDIQTDTQRYREGGGDIQTEIDRQIEESWFASCDRFLADERQSRRFPVLWLVSHVTKSHGRGGAWRPPNRGTRFFRKAKKKKNK